MNKVAIVILNYLNYKDTIECVESILRMKYVVCGIIIVDNGSYNDSYINLNKRYKKNKKIKIISNNKNEGFAKGNNIGIDYARKKLNADYVLVVNNDTIFIDKDYIKNLLEKYRSGIGVIGGGILLKNGYKQPPFVDYFSFKDYVLHYINILSKKYGSSFEFPENQGPATQILHGCTLLFTPDFFRYYTGFYKRTFLYGEEAILYLMCQCKSLKQLYVPEVIIYHKEDQSSLLSFQNDDSIHLKYIIDSTKYIIWWIIRYNIHLLLKNIEIGLKSPNKE